ncbi:serine hydrolase [Kitasatospora sp. NPDC004531]
MGKSPQSEPRDGTTRPAEAEAEERAPREGGSSTVHLRVRDAEESTNPSESATDLDLPEAGAALTADAPGLRLGRVSAAKATEEEESADAPAVAEPTMTLRVEPGEKAEEEPEDVEESGEAEAAAGEPEAEDADEKTPAPVVVEPTMTLRVEKAEKDETAEEDAEAEEADEKPAPVVVEPTMALRVEKAAEPEAEAGESEDEDADDEAKPAPATPELTMTLRIEKVEKVEEKPAPAVAEPTMTLRIGKVEPDDEAEESKDAPAKPEQTVMLRLPKDGTASKPTPAPTPAPAKPSPPAKPVAASAPVLAPAAAAAPAAAGPESTVEALEVLKALSARPMTPLRRAMKRVVIWGVFLAVVFGVLASVQLLRPLPAPKAKLGLADSFTFQGGQLNIPWPAKGQAAAEVIGVGDLGSSGEETPVPIASVTKVMNAYLILQAHPLKKGQTGPMLTVDKQAAQESTNGDESRVTLVEGQQLSQYEALEMLMLPSANNVARLLARWDSGSEEAFVKKMNDTAKQLGMTNTSYADPAGYNNDTKSTAKDQVKLAQEVIKDEVFRQVIAEPDTNFKGQRIYNTNKLLGQNGMIGGKTGSSSPAQSCFMWAAVKEIGGVKRTLVGVTLGQPQTKVDGLVTAAQPVSQQINVAAQSALTGQTLAKQGDVVGYVSDGIGGKVPVVATKDLTVAGWSGITAHLTLTPIGRIAHTLPAGTQVGTLSAGDGADKIEVPVALQTNLAPPSIADRLLRLG